MDHGFHNYVSSPEGTVISNAIFNGPLTSHYNPGFAWGDFLFSSWEIHHLGNLEFFLLEPLNQIQVNVISISYDSWWVTFPSYPSHYYPYSVSFLHNLLCRKYPNSIDKSLGFDCIIPMFSLLSTWFSYYPIVEWYNQIPMTCLFYPLYPILLGELWKTYPYYKFIISLYRDNQ